MTEAKLPEGQEPMDDEKWAIRKSCELSKRDCKWRWIYDPVTNAPSNDQAVCVHCGRQTTLTIMGGA